VPTISLNDLWQSKLNGLLRNITDGKKIQKFYNELKVENTLFSYSGCNAWRYYSGGDLSFASFFQKPTAITMYVASSLGQVVPDMVQCSDETAVRHIFGELINPSPSLSAVSCGGKTWKIKDCLASGSPTVCVDCVDPCQSDFCTPLSPFYMGPCTSLGVSCSFPRSYMRTFEVDFFDSRVVFPAVTAVTSTVAKTSALLRVQLGGSGTVNCAVFVVGYKPTTVEEVFLQNIFSAGTLSRSANLTITSLVPSTSYDVYCVTQSSEGSIMPLSVALASKYSITTRCCKVITVQIVPSFIYQSEQSINALVITSDSIVNSALNIALRASYDGGLTKTNLQPPTVIMKKTATATATITASSTFRVGTLQIYASILNNQDYEISYLYNKSSVSIITRTQVSPLPVALSAVFSTNGASIGITFDSSTDRGGLTSSKSFACSSILTVVDTTPPKCSWASDTQLTLTLASNSAIALPYSLVILGNTIKAKCPISSCSSWPFISATILNIAAPTPAIIPTGKCFCLFCL
jgi:hypothetical protein